MVRAAILTSTLSSASGGIATSVPALVKALDGLADIEVHVIGLVDPSDREAWQNWGPNVHSVQAFDPYLKLAPRYRATIAALAPDVTDAQGLWLYPSLANDKHHRQTACPYVVTPRGMLEPWSLARSRWRKAIVARWFENAHLRGANCLRATAESEARSIRQYGLTQPIAVVPNGVDIPALHPKRNAGQKRLLFLSRIHPKKGLPFLIRAWSELTSDFHDWELVIAGPDEVGHTRQMLQLAKELEVPRIVWTGAVHGEEKQRLYNEADLFVLPTHSENFGLVVAEALASSVPVITTTGTPWQDLGEQNCGWCIDLDEDGALVSAMRQAMSLSSHDRARMGASGRTWMKNQFAWTIVAEKMHDVYQWVVGGGAPPPFIMTD